MHNDFSLQVGNKSKFILSQKIKKRVKYTTIRVLQAKSFGNISFYDRCRRSVHSAREGIKIKLALFMAQSIPSVPIPPAFLGHLSFCFGKAANAPRWVRAFIQKPLGGALK